MTSPEPPPLSLTQQFMDSFNQIEKHIRVTLGANPGQPFVSMINAYYQARPWDPGVNDLRAFASLRNVIVHTSVGVVPLFTASEEAVRRIKAIAEQMLAPALVVPHFAREVVTVAPHDSLWSVLVKIREHNYSQFPVFDGSLFCGLLTENGITRWLAGHASFNDVSFTDVTVDHLLKLEERGNRHQFLGSDAAVAEVIYLFATNPELEAVLITHDGAPGPELKGIATPADVLPLRT